MESIQTVCLKSFGILYSFFIQCNLSIPVFQCPNVHVPKTVYLVFSNFIAHFTTDCDKEPVKTPSLKTTCTCTSYSSGLIQVETLEYSFLTYDIPGHSTTNPSDCVQSTLN